MSACERSQPLQELHIVVQTWCSVPELVMLELYPSWAKEIVREATCDSRLVHSLNDVEFGAQDLASARVVPFHTNCAAAVARFVKF